MYKCIPYLLTCLFFINSANAIQLEVSIMDRFVDEGAEFIEFNNVQLTRAFLKGALDDANNTACTKPTDYAGLVDGWDILSYSLKATTAVSLGFWGSYDIKASDTVYIFNLAFYKECRDDDGYITKRFGSGIGLTLKASNIGANASFSGLGAIAASTELNSAEVSYQLKTFGISGAKVTAAMPELQGEYDIESHIKLFNAIEAIKAAATDAGTVFTPVVIVNVTSKEVENHHFVEAMARVWALSSIKNGISSRDSKRRSPTQSSFAKNVIDGTYRFIMKSAYRPNTRPSEIHKLQAKELLAIYNYDFKTD